ncbi:MAG: hypothetical protein IKU48_04780 [Clostridia bacterium]|nr:hypothetical protein [Clostridia bacterium]
MRYFRLFSVIFLVFSLLFFVWANYQFNKNNNTDFPVFSATDGVLELSINDPYEAIFEGLSATDATDGDLTKDIMVASISHFFDDYSVNVKYVVFDSHNNSSTFTRKVKYTDYTSPVFTLDTPPVYTLGRSFDLLNHIKVQDCLDGDISGRIRVVSNMVNNYSTGNYPVLLEVTNSFGDVSQITIWVSYLSKENSVSVKLHQYIVYVEKGEEFDPYKWISSVTDRYAVELDESLVEIQGNLDVNTLGSYQLIYSYNDGKLSGQSPLTVVVTERER